MLSLPGDLQLKIFQRATHVPNLLDIVPDPNDAFLPKCPSLSLPILIKNFTQSLPTRYALPLVCRAFNDASTPLLYQCLLLNTDTIPFIAASIKTYNLSLVCHLLIDLPTTFSICDSPEFLAIFTALPAGVQILSIQAQFAAHLRPPPLSLLQASVTHSAIMDVMARALGPTLRKLVMDSNAIELFPEPTDLDVLARSLVNLEAIVLRVYPMHWELRDTLRIRGMQLPAALPRLRYLYLDHTRVPFPATAMPTHVHVSLNEFVSSAISPSVTHLSLSVHEGAAFARFSAMGASIPGLVSLTLSGTHDALTRLLVACPLPPIAHLYFSAFYYHPGDEAAYVRGLQALVDAIGGLRTKGGAGLVEVRFSQDTIVENLRTWVGKGRVSMRALVGCGFAVVDREGQALVNVVPKGTTSGRQGRRAVVLRVKPKSR
ncbi:hypothetical protein OF83DRAFT_1286192 [Amylostereum chailletii]|nr:hypothetical protein OF83DRAFT_1286192 [Amylostereum chailletii]